MSAPPDRHGNALTIIEQRRSEYPFRVFSQVKRMFVDDYARQL